MRAISASGALAISVLALSACGTSEDGGITANLVFEEEGVSRRALTLAAVPSAVDRLQITALDAQGSTLAETNLYLNPEAGQGRLLPEGGTWRLQKVRAGAGRIVQAKAYLPESLDPRLNRAVAFVGRIEGVEVIAGRVADAGDLVLRPTPIRIPETDFDAPDPPNPVSANALPEGEALRVTFGQPAQADVSGYVLVLGTTAAATNPPTLQRGVMYRENDEVAPGLRVATIWPFQGPQIITLEGLENAVPYAVLVYAFDDDGRGGPLNYSLPGQDFGVPADTLPPGTPGGLSATALPRDQVQIRFVSPGEDGENDLTGRPAAYELRASQDRADVESADRFATLPVVQTPTVAAPGTTVTFIRDRAALGVPLAGSVFVGVRAVDASANPGPIAVAELAINATLAPSLEALVPSIGIAGRELSLRGTSFGAARGTITLEATETSSATFTMPISRWEDSVAVVTIPLAARSGTLTLRRVDGMTVSTFLAIILRDNTQLDDHEYPFELVGTGASDGRSIAALYREANDFSPFAAAIDRLFGRVLEGAPFVPFNQAAHSTAIGGTYSPSYDLFMFVASNTNLTMTSAFVTSSTLAPDATRLTNGVMAGQADSVSVVLMDGGTPTRAPAMIAFTRLGTLRTATVADARVQPFDAFYAVTSTLVSYDRATLGRLSNGELLLAHRTVTGAEGVLSLRRNTLGGPADFTEVVIASPPRSGPGIEVRAVPTVAGGADRFLIAYDYVTASGALDVRLLWLDQYGVWPGYAPFPPTVGDRFLEDVGMVFRQGRVWLSVLARRDTGSAELTYAEVPLDAIDIGEVPGRFPGVVLDIAPDDTRARLGCKPFPQRACPIAWTGDDAAVVFLRQ